MLDRDHQPTDDRQRRLRAGYEALRAHGAPPSEDPLSVQAAHVLTVRLYDVLSDADEPERASAAARAALEIYDVSLERHPPRLDVGCRKGCAHCCHVRVDVTAPEAFLLARAIREGPDAPMLVERVRATGEMTAGLDIAQRLRLAMPCPMLVANACSRYHARPLPCRGYASTSAEHCRLALAEGDGARIIATPGEYASPRFTGLYALLAALAAAGYEPALYEMIAALRVALSVKDAEARWLAGEDVFADVPGKRVLEPGVDERIARLLAETGLSPRA